MTTSRTAAAILVASAAAVVVPIAALRAQGAPSEVVVVPGQVVTGPPTTPQPTVPCTPLNGCGPGGGTIRNLAYAYIQRFCNGSAVPTPVGFTTFSLVYALGGQATEAAQFFGTLAVNGTTIPSAPLFELQPGEKDTRIRTAVIPNDAVFTATLTATGVPSGAPVFFANGSTTRIRMASGACPGAPVSVPLVPPTAPPISGGPVPLFPNVPVLTPTTVPGAIPPARLQR